MRRNAALGLALAGLGAIAALWAAADRTPIGEPPDHQPGHAREIVSMRRQDDFAAMETFRPGFGFWQHVFVLPDHSIAYGSALDGRLLVTFPTTGNWARDGIWTDPSLEWILDGQTLARKIGDRRDEVAHLLEDVVGPVLNNSTRGDALLPNVRKYGRFLAEWGAIYERFAVPADLGLAQVILESGLSPTRRSEANAIGFCQWLRRNWQRPQVERQFRTEQVSGANVLRVQAGTRDQGAADVGAAGVMLGQCRDE